MGEREPNKFDPAKFYGHAWDAARYLNPFDVVPKGAIIRDIRWEDGRMKIISDIVAPDCETTMSVAPLFDAADKLWLRSCGVKA